MAVLLLAIPLAQALDLRTQVDFDIPAQSLSAALIEFSHQARVQIIVRDDIGGQKTRGITGMHAIEEALKLLLGSSGLDYRVVGNTSIIIGHTRKLLPGSLAKPSPPPPATPERGKERQTAVVKEQAGPQHEGSQVLREARPILKPIVVLGSLLPSTRLESSNPIIVISADEIKERGFTSIADALQNVSINTGSFNNTAINVGYVWAAKTVSLFGLDPSYTKFLIDGRPIPNYSQTVQESLADVLITNLSSIPIDLVDHIEILPGSASSLYGSDAVAGVINIVLKKHARLATIDASYGWYGDGGGAERKLSLSASFDKGNWSVLLGAQITRQDPIWDLERGTTARNFTQGVGPAQPSIAAAVLSLSKGTEVILDPNNCAGMSGLWGGTVRPVTLPTGSYCGTDYGNSYGTLMNRDDIDSASAQITYTLNNHLQLYSDVLETYSAQSHATITFWNGRYFDSALNSLVIPIRFFAPEEQTTTRDGLLNQAEYENTLMANLGAKGDIANGWTYDFSATLSREGVDDRKPGLYANSEPNSFASYFFGPEFGTIGGRTPIYAADYAKFYTPLTPAQFDSFTARGGVSSSSRDDMVHVEVTNPALFALPGGDAGLAMIAEAGHQSWDYLPDQLYSAGQLYGVSLIASGGRRTRYASAAELKLPIVRAVSLDGSTRFDAYDAEGSSFSHGTYSIGLEVRPVRSVLIRGKYGTGFKAPSLIDEFEGATTANALATDYLNCGRLGFSGSSIGGCPIRYAYQAFTSKQTSNGGLKPITTQSWSYGIVWAPLAGSAVSVDYQHIAIKNEVLAENADYVLQNEWLCANGTLPGNSPTCQATASQIIRGPVAPGSALAGPISEVITTKINLAREYDNSINVNLEYGFDIPVVGHFRLDGSYVDILKHTQQTFPSDPVLDLLDQPAYSTEFKSKVNAGLSWNRMGWRATVYGTRFGRTPNFAAIASDGYSAPGAGSIAPWYIWNASVQYSLSDLTVSLLVNNAGNSMPPLDRTRPNDTNIPFQSGNYNPYGRQFVLEGRLEFGAR